MRMTSFAGGVKAAVSKAWQRVSKPVAGAVLTSSMIAATIVVAPGVAHATGDDYRAGSLAYGSARLIGVGSTAGSRDYNDVIGVGGTNLNYRYDDNPTPVKQTNKVISVVDKGFLPFGEGLPLPLLKTEARPNGLLDLGTLGLGVAGATTRSDSRFHSASGTGLVSSDGVVDLNLQSTTGYKPVTLNVAALLSQLLTKEVTDAVLKDLTIQLGVGGSNAELSLKDGVQQLHSNYNVAEAKLNIDAPLVAGLEKLVTDVLVDSIGSLLAKDLARLPLVGAVVAPRITLPTNALHELLDEPLANGAYTYEWDDETGHHSRNIPAGLLSINLRDGIITVDLAKLHSGDGIGGANGLNGLPPNTELLTSRELNLIIATLTRVLGSSGTNDPTEVTLLTKLESLLEGVIEETTVSIQLLNVIGNILDNTDAITRATIKSTLSTLGISTTAPLELSVQLSDPVGTLALYTPVPPSVFYPDGKINLLGIPILGDLLKTAVKPVVDTLLLIVKNLPDTILSKLLTQVTTKLIDPLITNLSKVFEVLTAVVDIRINRQFVRTPNSAYNYGDDNGNIHDMTPGANGDLPPIYRGESFSVAAAEITLVNWSIDKVKAGAISVTLAESDVRVSPLTSEGKMTCTTNKGEPCLTITGYGLFDPATENVSLTYRGETVGADSIISKTTDESKTNSQGMPLQTITFIPPKEPLTGWKKFKVAATLATDSRYVDLGPAPKDNPASLTEPEKRYVISNEAVVGRSTTPVDNMDPDDYMTTQFGGLAMPIPARKLGTAVTYTDAVVAPGTGSSPEVTLTAATPAEGDTFYGLDTGGVKALLGWALDSNLDETQKLTDLRNLITEADEAAAAAAAAASATPTSTEAPTPDNTGTETGTGTATTTAAPTETDFANAIAGMPVFWTSTTPSLDLASTKARAAVALIDAILAKSENITASDGSTNLEALQAQISAGTIVAPATTPIDSTNGTVTASVPAGQTGVIVPVMKMSTDCTISFAAAQLIKAPDYMGTLPQTGGSGVGLYGIVASLIAALTAAATWWLARRQPA